MQIRKCGSVEETQGEKCQMLHASRAQLAVGCAMAQFVIGKLAFMGAGLLPFVSVLYCRQKTTTIYIYIHLFILIFLFIMLNIFG